MTLELAGFYLFAVVAVSAATFLLIEGRTPLAASVGFTVLGLAIAGVLQGLGANFLAIGQWILSAGAALVLLISMVMVGGLGGEGLDGASPLRVLVKLVGAVAAAFLIGLLVVTVLFPGPVAPVSPERVATPEIAHLAQSLFGHGPSRILVLGLLLLAVLVGSVVLAKRRLD
jgi:NADH:ubiquinone oxidoreductase subunit 6 (subunit J)